MEGSYCSNEKEKRSKRQGRRWGLKNWNQINNKWEDGEKWRKRWNELGKINMITSVVHGRFEQQMHASQALATDRYLILAQLVHQGLAVDSLV